MSKTITVASKFTEEEIDKIDYFVAKNHTTRSALVHELVMRGLDGSQDETNLITKGNSDIREVKLLFNDDFSYFWKGKEYRGIINGEDVSIYFGGEWKNYKLDELPVTVEG